MNWSYIFIILTIFFWGSAAVCDKVALREAHPLSGLAIRSTAVIIAILLSGVFIRKMFTVPTKLPSRSILLFILSGLFAGFFGMLTYYSALKKLPTSVVVPLCSVYPLIAALLGTIILKEEFSLIKLLGVILIILGVWLVK